MQTKRISALEPRTAHLAKPADIVLVRTSDRQFERYLPEYFSFKDIIFLGFKRDLRYSAPKRWADHRVRLAFGTSTGRAGGQTDAVQLGKKAAHLLETFE